MLNWFEVAPLLGSQDDLLDLLKYNNKLYSTGRGVASSGSGILYEWDAVSAWVQVAPQHIESFIKQSGLCLEEYNNLTYCGTGQGGLLEWNGTNAWVYRAAPFASQTRIESLLAHDDGKLYASTNPHGKLFQWDDISAWAEKAPQLNSQTTTSKIITHNSKIYGLTSHVTIGGRLFEWNDINAWVQVAPQPGGATSGYGYDLIVHNNLIYALIGNKLYEWNGSNAWVEKAGVLNGEGPRSLVVSENELYCGTNPGGFLQKWNGTNAWIKEADQYALQKHISAMVVHIGGIFAVTAFRSDAGKLLAWGIIGTYTTPITKIKGGWQETPKDVAWNKGAFNGTEESDDKIILS